MQDHTEVLVDWLPQLWYEFEINWTPVLLMCWLQRNQNSHLQPNISPGWIFSSHGTVTGQDSFLWKPQLENVPCLVQPIREWVCFFATNDGVVGNSVSILNRVNFSSNTLSQCAVGQPVYRHWCTSEELVNTVPNHIPKAGKHPFKVGTRPTIYDGPSKV